MVQRQGIGRVRHLDASLLWIQQKEKEKILSVAPIPTDLNCADVGTKNLAKKRLLGLLYMLKMVNAVYDRIGEEEYEEIERTYQIKQSHKQIGNKKALRVCLLLLLANIDFIIVVAHLMDIEKVTIQNTENEVRMILERKDQATQATCLEDNSMQKKMDEEVAEMQAEYVKQDMYIEQLEERVKELQEQAAENFQMYELESRHARKLMNQMINLRKTPKGQCVHFSTRCPHFQEALKTVQTYSDVRSWEGGEPHLEPGSLQAIRRLGWETGEAQTLFVPEVPDRIPMFEGKGKTKNKTWKGSQKGGTPKGSQGKKGYKDATGEARGQRPDAAGHVSRAELRWAFERLRMRARHGGSPARCSEWHGTITDEACAAGAAR
eukprot:g30866.t1